jgi:hypothetical protein
VKRIALALVFAAGAAHAGACPRAEPQFALQMIECLADPDPAVRDALAFDSLQKWMRGGNVDTPTVQAMRVRLLAMLRAPDAAGFARPFAALTLAEVARIDRIKPFLAASERNEIVDAAVAYLSGVEDYRGFDEREGWRHGVAHGADLMLQLALNPQLRREQAQSMLGAIAKQAAPPGAVFYRYGEADRLAAPAYYLATRPFFTGDEWAQWFAGLVQRVPRDPRTQAALAARHNVSAFLASLYVSAREGGNAAAEEALTGALRKALRDLG